MLVLESTTRVSLLRFSQTKGYQQKAANRLCSLVFLFSFADVLQADAFATPREIVLRALKEEKVQTNPLEATVLFVPPELLSKDVIFSQEVLNERIQGAATLTQAASQWDLDFQSDLGVNASIGRVSTLSQTVVRVNWNVTWVPPTALWLEGVGELLKPNVETLYVTYNHLAQTPSTFSWNGVFRLLEDAIMNGKLRIPIACIEGNTELVFSNSEPDNKVVRITESLSYAEDLRRGALQNRKCSQDLRLFLEAGRRMTGNLEEWDTKVALGLPWQSVAGFNPLDVDPVEEGPLAALAFIGFAALGVTLFAAVLAPELIGQNLFSPPTYIVRPEDLNSLY